MKPANDNGSRLAARRKQFDIPEIPYLPIGKNVLVFRIPEEDRTAGGLYIPDTNKEPKSQGVLLAAGLGALDILADHLVEIGDMVWFGKYAGWESEVRREAESKGTKILQVKVEDVLGSVDARERLGDYSIDRDEDGEHFYAKRAS
jgi:chaperonin GroES